MKSLKQLTGLALAAMILFAGCGGQDPGKTDSSTTASGGLSEFEMANGIGPVTEEITIAEVDQSLAEKGAQIFKTKCSACHKMEDRYVGPPLGNVLEARTPAFVMNMILNPEQMLKEHPVGKQLLAEYMTPMPNQNLEREEARAIVEYLASDNK